MEVPLCTVSGMTDSALPSPSAGDETDDAARLGLAVVGEASALHDGGVDSLVAAEENLRDTVDELIDEPLTDRQEQVVEALAVSSASLTAGLAGAVAVEQDRAVGEVLEGAARSILMQQRAHEQAEHRRDDA